MIQNNNYINATHYTLFSLYYQLQLTLYIFFIFFYYTYIYIVSFALSTNIFLNYLISHIRN